MARVVNRPITVVGVVVLALLVAFVVWTAPAVAAVPAAPRVAASTNLQVTLIRAGLDAEALAAAGVAPAQLGTCVAAVAACPQAAPGTLAQLDGAYADARTVHDLLERKVQSGLASEAEVTQLAAAKQALDTASVARDAAIDAIHAAGAAVFTAPQRATLAAIRSNRSWSLPVGFLTVNRTEEQWVALRKALANERIALKNGTTPNALCQALLATERARSEVAAAKTARDANLPAMKAAFDAIGD